MSFKERNPDLDFEDIMRNPNVPDDVKLYLRSSMSLTAEDEFKDELELDKNTNIHRPYTEDGFSESDDSQTAQKKKKKKNGSDYDDDWFDSVGLHVCSSTGNFRKKKTHPAPVSTGKKRGRPKLIKSEDEINKKVKKVKIVKEGIHILSIKN